ncbi:RNA polymerase RpoE-like sigma-24 subunit [Pacificibacter maritimus]|uniref:RNA polymerase RpoE-like sigma-24 subunit n=1 Tax=Pacificibacter maritimus TaxID=762213 RepID=A0A3N4UX19_9RHOB|nr:RNA polymerase RpoE-like sigma-24 subunit [Pacificibacter maritimus]
MLHGLRKLDMLETDHSLSEDAQTASRTLAQSFGIWKADERVSVTSTTKTSFSEQTEWMLKVRDQRCKTSFGALFDHFAPRLRGMLMKNGFGAAQADDVVQDVMLSVWRKAASFNPERAEVSGWIFQIARNRQIDVIRKERRPVPEELAMPESTDVDGEQVLGVEQETAKLRSAIARLNPEQRELVEKAYLGEFTHSEIRDQTGLPLGTIKSRIRLGLERLRHELKGER